MRARLGQVLYWTTTLCAVVTSSCGPLPEKQSAAQQNPESPPLQLDLTGGSVLWLDDVRTGQRTMLWNGQPISCAELKVTAPGLFRKLRENPPLITEDCQLSKTKTPQPRN